MNMANAILNFAISFQPLCILYFHSLANACNRLLNFFSAFLHGILLPQEIFQFVLFLANVRL